MALCKPRALLEPHPTEAQKLSPSWRASGPPSLIPCRWQGRGLTLVAFPEALHDPYGNGPRFCASVGWGSAGTTPVVTTAIEEPTFPDPRRSRGSGRTGAVPAATWSGDARLSESEGSALGQGLTAPARSPLQAPIGASPLRGVVGTRPTLEALTGPLAALALRPRLSSAVASAGAALLPGASLRPSPNCRAPPCIGSTPAQPGRQTISTTH